MSHDSQIIQAAFTRLTQIQNAPPIAWPGINFTPPNQGAWLEVSLFPNEPDDRFWSGERALQIGFIQVSVCVRPGIGLANPTALAESVIAHFPKGLEIGPVKVRKRPYLRPAVTVDHYYFVPVTIPYIGLA